MSIGSSIVNILNADSTVHGLVGDRILPFGADQTTTKPYITYQQISKVINKHKDRTLKNQVVRMQIDCFATSYDSVTTLADAVCNALCYADNTHASGNIDVIVFEDENDLFSDQPQTFRKQQDYFIRLKF